MSPHASDGHEAAAVEPADEDDEQEVGSHAAAGTSIRQQEHRGFPDLAEQLLVEVSPDPCSMGSWQPSQSGPSLALEHLHSSRPLL